MTRAWLIAGFILAAQSVPGVLNASTGGPYRLVKQIATGAGGGLASGGGYSFVGSAQGAAGSSSAGGVYIYLSGYLTAFPAPFVLSANIIPHATSYAELFLGVNQATMQGEARFNISMSSSSVLNATTVYLLMDNEGNEFNTPVAFDLSYDSMSLTLSLQPSSYPLESGYLYGLVISTGAADMYGTPMDSPFLVRFQTLTDFSGELVAVSSDCSVRVEIPPGSFSGTGYVAINLDPVNNPDNFDSAKIEIANGKSVRNFGVFSRSFRNLEVNAYSELGQVLAGEFPSYGSLAVSISDSGGDGIVDGTNPPVRIARLALWYLDENSNLWERVPGSAVSRSSSTVTVRAPIRHLSVYGLIALADEDVGAVYAYPVPWRPYSGDPARYGTLEGGITFVNIPQTGSVRIYTLGGQIVKEHYLEGPQTWVWDGKNNNGETVASGVYLWIVKSGNNKKKGKLMIIR